mmetsp:Transcript_112282/g.362617  ORF Transcript_112282/g.362617 Transcript_112282/m.362617 type:complete len:256 (-) Transcript_112282:483-1250(-)
MRITGASLQRVGLRPAEPVGWSGLGRGAVRRSSSKQAHDHTCSVFRLRIRQRTETECSVASAGQLASVPSSACGPGVASKAAATAVSTRTAAAASAAAPAGAPAAASACSRASSCKCVCRSMVAKACSTRAKSSALPRAPPTPPAPCSKSPAFPPPRSCRMPLSVCSRRRRPSSAAASLRSSSSLAKSRSRIFVNTRAKNDSDIPGTGSGVVVAAGVVPSAPSETTAELPPSTVPEGGVTTGSSQLSDVPISEAA